MYENEEFNLLQHALDIEESLETLRYNKVVISPDEFKFMIGPDMRLDPVRMEEGKGIKEMLAFYMGKNTPQRQEFIIRNLRSEVDAA